MKTFNILPWYLLLLIVVFCVAIMNTTEGMDNFTIKDNTTMDDVTKKLNAKGTKHLIPKKSNVKVVVLSKNTTSSIYKEKLANKFRQLDNMDIQLLFSKSDDTTNKILKQISTNTLNNKDFILLEPNPGYIPEDPSSLYVKSNNIILENRIRSIIKTFTKPEKRSKEDIEDEIEMKKKEEIEKIKKIEDEQKHAREVQTERERRQVLSNEREKTIQMEFNRRKEIEKDRNITEKVFDNAKKNVRNFFK
jgi:hypothetical protein